MTDQSIKIDLGPYGEVQIDPQLLHFSEASLSKYMEQEAGWYNYFSQKLTDAERWLADLEYEYELKYQAVFRTEKGDKASDKLAEARAKTDHDVAEAGRKMIAAKHAMRKLQVFMRAFDKNHDNATSRGHTLRKEMDRLGNTIYGGTGFSDRGSDYGAAEVDNIVKPADKQDLSGLPAIHGGGRD
jgi:hypothetical protein